MSDQEIKQTVDTSRAHTPAPADTVNGARQLRFSVADVKARLVAAGLSPTDLGTVRQPFLGPVGRSFGFKGGEAQAYVYGDAVALAEDIASIDTARVQPRNTTIVWRQPPALIVTNNVAVILLTSDPKIRESVRRSFASY
jgi:hypothetical protein